MCRDREIQIKREHIDNMQQAICRMNAQLNNYGPIDLDEDDIVEVVEVMMDALNDHDEVQVEHEQQQPQQIATTSSSVVSLQCGSSESHLESVLEPRTIETEQNQPQEATPALCTGPNGTDLAVEPTKPRQEFTGKTLSTKERKEPEVERQIIAPIANQQQMAELPDQYHQQQNFPTQNANIPPSHKSLREDSNPVPVQSASACDAHVHDASETDFAFSFHHPFVVNVRPFAILS